ncbi:S-adenosylmethionine decarboxylase family protein [Tellurirhabdus bombi]|uniref:S-adenosylmethionine decarboxylase family protein n=1 Tax=Tellurirhabdus bombi TaxID=2907205 RepID=UPI001F1D7957|nr:S-adenosylmethionine decarboxylase [Tellurirhabdus bombi]
MNTYKPGSHILASFTASSAKLTDVNACRAHFNQLIDALNLEKVGEVYHEFPNGGFTAVIALSESHISIHTWPENDLATFDVFLSNFLRDNTERAQAVFQETIQYFDAKVKNRAQISR